ncbi:MAG: Rieske 2Fe-2S domain-containing protein [Phycisphaerales bacterium JB061]
MSNRYVLVQWNAHKKVYDLAIAFTVVAYLAVFVGIGMATHTPPSEFSPPVLLIRAFGSLAIVMLHIILSIGPLCRLDERFAPLLYNRRHLGVAFFFVVLMHFVLVLGFYGGFGNTNPLSAVLAGTGGVPFEFFGFLAFLVFFLMAATSHDFWLANLGPRFWKALHMGVYVAYFLVILHVALGPLQDKGSPLVASLLMAGAAWLGSLHIAAGQRERQADRESLTHANWVDVCDVSEIPESRARVVRVGDGERIAVVRHNGNVTAVSNVCSHQGGPLGEGQVIDGCLTCPWHGYQYDPATGCSPPPYTEKVNTYEVRVEGSRVMLNPNPSGTSKEATDG